MKINFSSLKVYVNTEIQKLHNVFSPILHSHGNITSNGMIGDSNNNANKNVVTDENGQITIEEKTEGLDSFNYGYIDENLQCHLIKVEEINILSADSQLLPSEDFNLSGEIITDDETNNPIAVKIYLNNNYLETVYTYGYDKSFDFSIEDSELISGENTIKMQCGNVVVEHTCLLSQDTLTLTSDKNILSYANEDSCTLTATLTRNNVGINGETITFKNGNTVLDTVQTDSNGEATYEYNSQGVGDIIITAECNGLSETYDIQDCSYYSITEYKQNTSGITVNIALPPTFILEYDIKPTSRTTSNYGSTSYLRIGEDSNNGIWAGQLNSAGGHGLVSKPSGTTQLCTSNTVLNEDNHITIYFSGTNVIYSCNDETVSLSASNLSKINAVVPTTNNELKNIKIKPSPKVDKPEKPETDELEGTELQTP